MAIFESIGKEHHYTLSESREGGGQGLVRERERGPTFGNGRLARNLFEDCVARQANRIVGITDPSDEQLVTLVADDIPAPGVT